jgi:hypothetical protein
MKPVIGLCLGLLALLIWAGISSDREYARLVRQCIDDGRKEYECVAMLKPDAPPVVVPVVIQP